MSSTWGNSWGTAWGDSWGLQSQPQAYSGGWFPYQRIRTRKEIRDERIELGILPPDVVEEVLPKIAAVQKSRRKYVLTSFLGKDAVADISTFDIEEAVKAYRLKRQREDEELLLLH